MGATFEDMKRNIRKAIGEKETPEQIVKTCLDAICLMHMAYGVDPEEIRKKWLEGKEV